MNYYSFIFKLACYPAIFSIRYSAKHPASQIRYRYPAESRISIKAGYPVHLYCTYWVPIPVRHHSYHRVDSTHSTRDLKNFLPKGLELKSRHLFEYEAVVSCFEEHQSALWLEDIIHFTGTFQTYIPVPTVLGSVADPEFRIPNPEFFIPYPTVHKKRDEK
jgi:hypothetical protein